MADSLTKYLRESKSVWLWTILIFSAGIALMGLLAIANAMASLAGKDITILFSNTSYTANCSGLLPGNTVVIGATGMTGMTGMTGAIGIPGTIRQPIVSDFVPYINCVEQSVPANVVAFRWVLGLCGILLLPSMWVFSLTYGLLFQK